MVAFSAMLGFFGIFGRSRDLQRLDQAVRAAGVHPRLIPEAVKLTALKLLQQADGGGRDASRAFEAAAEMLGYCHLGPQGFSDANGRSATEAVEARLEAALDGGDTLDARLVLLGLHAGIIHADVLDRYRLEAE